MSDQKILSAMLHQNIVRQNKFFNRPPPPPPPQLFALFYADLPIPRTIPF